MGEEEPTRKEKISKLSKLLYDNCIAVDPQRFEATGSISPSRTLRRKATREAFMFARHLPGRWFTKSLVRDALHEFVKDYQPKLPEVPGFTLQMWVEQQASEVRDLLSRARKSTAGKENAMANPDELETQHWEFDEDEDRAR